MTVTLTGERLRAAFPKAHQNYLDAIIAGQDDLAEVGILSEELRLSHFLGQGAAETGGFTIYEESGNYSAQRLLTVFPKYFKSLSEARAYANKPEAIFNRTYGGRLGNNNAGDGYKYRGRGINQLTGKDAYREFGEIIGLDLVGFPELAAVPKNSLKIYIAYWSRLKLNEWADKDDTLAVSRGINGGNPKRNIQPNGMQDRLVWTAKVKKVLAQSGQEPDQREELSTLREGSHGSEVEKLQSALRSKGYAPGAIDGIFGANTRRAVETFQKEHGSDGESGVWKAIYWPELNAAENIQTERQTVTAQDLHKAGDPAVVGLTWGQRILMFLGFGGAITGGASEGASNFPALVSQYQPVIDVFRPLFQWLATNGWILVIILALAAWFLARYAINHIVKAYQHFDYQGAYKKVE